MIRPFALLCILGVGACGSTNGGPDPADGATPPSDAPSDARSDLVDPGPAGPISAVLDGTRWNFTEQARSAYASTDNLTSIAGQARPDASIAAGSVLITTPGKAPGTFRCGDGGGVATSISFSGPAGSYSTTGSSDLTPCTVIIASYGAVGGRVVGTFDGVLLLSSGSTGSPRRITATTGTFDVVRAMDK